MLLKAQCQVNLMDGDGDGVRSRGVARVLQTCLEALPSTVVLFLLCQPRSRGARLGRLVFVLYLDSWPLGPPPRLPCLAWTSVLRGCFPGLLYTCRWGPSRAQHCPCLLPPNPCPCPMLLHTLACSAILLCIPSAPTCCLPSLQCLVRLQRTPLILATVLTSLAVTGVNNCWWCAACTSIPCVQA